MFLRSWSRDKWPRLVTDLVTRRSLGERQALSSHLGRCRTSSKRPHAGPMGRRNHFRSLRAKGSLTWVYLICLYNTYSTLLVIMYAHTYLYIWWSMMCFFIPAGAGFPPNPTDRSLKITATNHQWWPQDFHLWKTSSCPGEAAITDVHLGAVVCRHFSGGKWNLSDWSIYRRLSQD